MELFPGTTLNNEPESTYRDSDHVDDLNLFQIQMTNLLSLILRLPDVFNMYTKEGAPGIQSHVTNVTHIHRVAGHEN